MNPVRKSNGKLKPDSGGLYLAYLLLLTFEWLGLQNDLPFLKAIRFTTLLAYALLIAVIARGGIGDTPRRPQARILFAFIGFTVLSMMWAVVTLYAFNAIRPLVDFTAFFFVTVALVDRPKRIMQLSYTFVLIVTTLVIRNFDTLGDAARASAFAAGPFLGDGNDFAWGMVIALPIIAYLALGNHGAVHRIVGIVGVLICLIGIVGTGSRGSSLGLAGALLFYWLFVSRSKLKSALAVALLALAVVILSPSGYLDRMNTIKSYEEDSSAQSRLMLWRAAIAMARDYPLGVGAGNFSSAYGRFYAPVGERSDSASDVVWAPGRWLSAHSVYFKTLGEYGVLGFGLLIALVIVNFRDCFAARARMLTQGDQAKIAAEWPSLLAMSFCGFAICAVFLGGLAYPHLFLLSGLVVATRRLTDDALPSGAESPRTLSAWRRNSRPRIR